jgi:hypothetical protein
MVNKELLEIPLSDLGLNDPLPDPVTYQYYKGLKEKLLLMSKLVQILLKWSCFRC